MDFETNFDKALLSVGQTGGQDTAATPATGAAPLTVQESAIDTMLMQELGEAKSRIEKLEKINSGLTSRSTQLESNAKALQKERDEARDRTSRLQMEVRMAQMEAEHASRAMQEKAASLEEMQMEIDLVTKASAKAIVRAAKGEEAANSLKTDRQKVVHFEAQVQALQEWALASAESKRLMQERVKILENKLRLTQGKSVEGDASETTLFSKKGSLVIGAGDKGIHLVELGHHSATVDARFVVLRWKFDISPSELNIDFNILKGKCETAAEQKKADYVVKDRVITGGAGGENEGTFNVDNACTLLWSNAQSWVRPRTVTYTVDVISLK
jgi:myosin heavy subunit